MVYHRRGARLYTEINFEYPVNLYRQGQKLLPGRAQDDELALEEIARLSPVPAHYQHNRLAGFFQVSACFKTVKKLK